MPLFSLGRFLNLTTLDKGELKKRIDLVRSFSKIQHIEILWEMTDFSENLVDFLAEELKDYRLIIHAPFTSLTLASRHSLINQASVEALQKVYDAGLKLGAEVFTIHAGYKPAFSQSEEETNKKIVESLSRLRTNDDLKCTLENMPLRPGTTTVAVNMSLVETEKTVNLLPEFGFTLDIGHVIQNQEEWQGWFITNKNKIYNIHLHGGFFHGQAHRELTVGDLNCVEFIKFLHEQEYNKFVTLEVVGEERIKQSWEYLIGIC